MSSPKLEMLLTSAGPTTEAMQERLLKLGRAHSGRHVNVLRIADGWAPFASEDSVGMSERIEQRLEPLACRRWSKRYLGYVLGNMSLKTIYAGRHDEQAFGAMLRASDLLVVPGGNTYQTMRGLAPHRGLIQDQLQKGLAYMGDSAGSIVAGSSIKSAGLAPADTKPSFYDGFKEAGLGLIDASIVVHAAGRKDRIAVPGPTAIVAGMVLNAYETAAHEVTNFVAIENSMWVDTFVLNDLQALSVSGDMITQI